MQVSHGDVTVLVTPSSLQSNGKVVDQRSGNILTVDHMRLQVTASIKDTKPVDPKALRYR